MISPQTFSQVINGYMPEPEAGLLNGILLGINLKSSKEFYLDLQKVGLVHMVVLSGTNIVILSSMVMSATRLFSRNIRIVITIIIVILFVLFVSPQAPIVRAALMSILTSVSIVFGKKTFTLYLLILSAIISISIHPAWISSISFQLSYAATLGIILFGPSTVLEKKDDSFLSELIPSIKQELQLSLAAQVFTAPIIFIYFRQISLIAPLSNILTSWLITPLMILGFMTAILGKVHYTLGVVPAYLSFGLLRYMVIIIRLLADIPGIFINF